MFELERDANGVLKLRKLKSQLERVTLEGYLELQWPTRTRNAGSPPVFRVRDVGECPRSIALRLLGTPPPPPTPRSIRMMQDGKDAELRIKAGYERSGHVSHNGVRLKRSFRVVDDTSPDTWGYVDVSGECDLILDMCTLVEIKRTGVENYKRWRDSTDLPRQMVDQTTFYQKLYECTDGLVHLSCRDSTDYRLLHVERDDDRVYYHLYNWLELGKLIVKGVLPEPNHKDLYCQYGDCLEYGAKEEEESKESKLVVSDTP